LEIISRQPGLVLELEHLKIETRLIDEKSANAMGAYVTESQLIFFFFPDNFCCDWKEKNSGITASDTLHVGRFPRYIDIRLFRSKIYVGTAL